MKKLWGGRFEKKTIGFADDFHSSISFDVRLYAYDIQGSIAHAQMLGECNIITSNESQSIIVGLQGILNDLENGALSFSPDAEDVHSNIEALLIERIGVTGKKLHTGRSRNDQVALDCRMFVKDEIAQTIAQLGELEITLLGIAEAHLDTIMPGYTHMQKAQPITLAHHAMAYFQMFKRDIERFKDAYVRADIMPLGSGALATTTYPLNRARVAELLGFSAITENSIDAVSDRDYVIEFISCASMTMMHLSRYCEELILWSSNEFQFVEMDDSYATGSSIMPQKKNSDMAELIRGKTGRVYGDLMAVLSMMKSLPLAYNTDMQEDKEALFDAVDTLKSCLKVFIGMISTLKFNTENMKKGAIGGYTNATDAADYLTKKDLPFRTAHEVIGQLVLYCIAQNKGLLDLTLPEFQQFSPLFAQDIYDAISMQTCVNSRSLPGGPAKESVLHSIANGRAFLEQIAGL